MKFIKKIKRYNSTIYILVLVKITIIKFTKKKKPANAVNNVIVIVIIIWYALYIVMYSDNAQ